MCSVVFVNYALKNIFFIGLVFFCMENVVWANESFSQEYKSMIVRYYNIKEELLKNSFDVPVALDFCENNSFFLGDIYGVIDFPYDKICSSLTDFANWCDIVFLHFNIKACLNWKENGVHMLSFYSGSKYYQPSSRRWGSL